MEKNSGPAVCRNLGIEHASGDYVCFVDDDDTLGEPYGYVKRRLSYNPDLKYKFFENMYPLLGKSDIILCRRVMIESDKDKISHCESPNDTDEDVSKLLSYQRAHYMHGMQYICGSLFRRKMLVKHNIRFISGLEPNEDCFFGSLAGYYAKTIKTAYDSVYGYHSRPNSLSRSDDDMMRMQKLLLFNNRQLPVLLSHLLLKAAKHKELCRFVYDFHNSSRRLVPQLFIQGVDINQYSFLGSFPRKCLECEQMNAVCNGLSLCPNTTEFEQFIKYGVKEFLPKNFDIESI
jgi:glycosyltransferase involved in cell wall biosynthesis